MNSKRWAVVLLVTVSACARLVATARRDAESLVRRQAAFDFDCPEPQLEIIQLDTYDVPTTYGVSGCGHRARYVDTGWPDHPPRWIANTVDGEIKCVDEKAPGDGE
jgi:hypothetical protein